MFQTAWILFCTINIGLANVAPRVQSFIDYEIVPDILSTPPATLLSVTFPSGVQALEGEVVPVDQIVEQPTLEWDADPDRLYAVFFLDPDATVRSFLHWFVVNVPGNDVSAGEVAATFINSQPRAGSGLHRYTFLVYEQPEEIITDDFLEYIDWDERRGFSVEDFANTYNLGTLLAGNFYRTQNLEDAQNDS